jgi:hypothetical protein
MALLLCWLGGILGLLAWFAQAQMHWFDPQQRLASAAADLQFDAALVRQVQQQSPDLRMAVVHFRQQDCMCDGLAQAHSLAIDQQLRSKGFHSEEMLLNPTNPLNQFIPSTPAVAVFNEQAQLIYLGPYSVGLGCISGAGLVDKIVSSASIPYIGALINSDAKGCYCNT